MQAGFSDFAWPQSPVRRSSGTHSRVTYLSLSNSGRSNGLANNSRPLRHFAVEQSRPREAAWSTLRRSGTFPTNSARVESSGTRHETIAWCAVAALALATVLRLSPVELPIFQWGRPEQPQLQLSASQDPDGIRLEWLPPGNSSGGILRAVDDDGLRTVALSAPVVMGGHIHYGPVHGDARFELAIQVGSSGWKSERIAYLPARQQGARHGSATRPKRRLMRKPRTGRHSGFTAASNISRTESKHVRSRSDSRRASRGLLHRANNLARRVWPF